jgi:hypothetical protein
MVKAALLMFGLWPFAAQANAQPANIPILTVCEALDKAGEYHERVVIVIGASNTLLQCMVAGIW